MFQMLLYDVFNSGMLDLWTNVLSLWVLACAIIGYGDLKNDLGYVAYAYTGTLPWMSSVVHVCFYTEQKHKHHMQQFQNVYWMYSSYKGISQLK